MVVFAHTLLGSLSGLLQGFYGKYFATSYGKGIGTVVASSLVGSTKFWANKIMHRAATYNIGKTLPFINKIAALDYYVGRDEKGILRGGNLHWQYMQNICLAYGTREQKYKELCRILAQLPGNVAFAFKASPDLHDAEIVRAAFATAGFVNEPRQTYLYKGDAKDGDPLKKLKSDSRTKVNSARRDLEVTTMNVQEFFAFYRENLDSLGKQSHFWLNIDETLITESMSGESAPAEIIAVRKKSIDADKGPHPIDAAILCSRGADGYYKLMRITYRRESETNAHCQPHKHATKMLVVEAMKRSSELGLTLDVDGATPGGSTVYSRFGVFETVVHDEYTRKTAQTFIRKFL